MLRGLVGERNSHAGILFRDIETHAVCSNLGRTWCWRPHGYSTALPVRDRPCKVPWTGCEHLHGCSINSVEYRYAITSEYRIFR